MLLHSRRIISLAPSLTEFLVRIGAADLLVGVSDYCHLPANLDIPRLGGVSNPDLTILRDLNPDVILLDRSPGAPLSPAVLDHDLSTISVMIRSVSGAVDQLQTLAFDLGLADLAAPLMKEYQQAIDAAYEEQARRRLRRVVVFTWRDPWMAVGGDTYADDLLRLCGAENMALRLPGHSPRAGLDAFMRYNPQVILLAGGPYPFTHQDIQAFWRFGDVEAIVRRRVMLCEERLLTRYGASTPEAITTISALLHC